MTNKQRPTYKWTHFSIGTHMNASAIRVSCRYPGKHSHPGCWQLSRASRQLDSSFKLSHRIIHGHREYRFPSFVLHRVVNGNVGGWIGVCRLLIIRRRRLDAGRHLFGSIGPVGSPFAIPMSGPHSPGGPGGGGRFGGSTGKWKKKQYIIHFSTVDFIVETNKTKRLG